MQVHIQLLTHFYIGFTLLQKNPLINKILILHLLSKNINLYYYYYFYLFILFLFLFFGADLTFNLRPIEHFHTIYVHVREGRLVYLQKFTGAG
jgi:hypothetical protein